MNKKTFGYILVAFLMAQFSFAASISGYASIKGTFSDQELKPKEIILYKAEEGKPVVAATTKLNALGEFGFMIPIATPGFYYVDYGQFKNREQLIRLYLEPNLDIQLAITAENYTLSGKNIGQNALVYKANGIYNDFSYYSRLLVSTTYKDFYPFIDKGLAKADTFIKSINTKDVAFNKLLKLAVETDVEELSYMFFKMPKSEYPERGNVPAIMKQWRTNKNFSNPDILKLANGVALMSNYFFYDKLIFGDMSQPRISLTEAITHVTDPTLRDVFLRDYLTTSNIATKEYEKVIVPVLPYLTSDASKAFVVEFEKRFHKNVGQKGFEFSYKDSNDKPVQFSDFKGKYVYIDLWATWCAPCKAEIPHMKKLEEDYHDKNIAFISISLDKIKDTQKWKDFVKNKELQGIQLMADKDFDSAIAVNYDVNSIPRFLLFDPQGNILNVNEKRPSEPELRMVLDKLLK